jgi:hypothetical protein
VNDAVLAACDAADGLADGIVSDAVGCRQRFDVTRLQCAAGVADDACLGEAQVRAVQALHASYRFPFKLENGLDEYPGWGVSGEALPAFGPTGGWNAWWLGTSAPTLPQQPTNSIAWIYGSGAIQYFYARDPNFDVRRYKPEDFAARVAQISSVMDSTNPDLATFQAHGGKLILLENMADYAQSPYAGIQYYEAVVARMGKGAVDSFMRFYTAPGVDHVGSGAPANADIFPALVDWVERGRAPSGLQLVDQPVQAPFSVTRSRPLCEWPLWPRYRGGNADDAGSFTCSK